MRIASFVPSAASFASAGVRIRYNRLRPALAALGHSFEVRVIDDPLPEGDPGIDVAIVTKVHDSRSVALARRLRDAGVRVGVDIFDDYVSQQTDPRLTPQRGWLAQLAPHLEFGLCATSVMQGRLARLLPGLPVHVLNDPHDALDPETVSRSVEAAAARARRDRVIDVAWFGMGDNGYFQVGLFDLAAFGAALSGFARRGYAARLTILTNPRAMTLERLEALARLPIPWEIEEWSEARQDALLARALVTFLPTNAQLFSTVKSPNRAVSALLGGTQVLSAGYPLYTPFGDLIYRDAGRIVDDLERDGLKARRETLPMLARLLSRTGDPAHEAGGLATFLSKLPPPARAEATPPLVVVHGKITAGTIHKTVQRLGDLSAAHPFVPPQKLDYDLRLSMGDHGLQADLSSAARGRLRCGLPPLARPSGGAGAPFRIDLPGDLPGACLMGEGRGAGQLELAALYEPGLDLVRAAAAHLFGPVELAVSERAPPFGARRARAPAARAIGAPLGASPARPLSRAAR